MVTDSAYFAESFKWWATVVMKIISKGRTYFYLTDLLHVRRKTLDIGGLASARRLQEIVIMTFYLREILRSMASPEKKKSVFRSEKEAYDFCRSLYHKTGGVTPELQRAYEFYQKSINDDCQPEVRPH